MQGSIGKYIAEETGGDLFHIRPVTLYPDDYTKCIEVALFNYFWFFLVYFPYNLSNSKSIHLKKGNFNLLFFYFF